MALTEDTYVTDHNGDFANDMYKNNTLSYGLNQTDMESINWTLWVNVGVPLVCIFVFVGVSLIIFFAHKIPEDDSDVPMKSIDDTSGQEGPACTSAMANEEVRTTL